MTFATIAETSTLVGDGFAQRTVRPAAEGAAPDGDCQLVRLRSGFVAPSSDAVDLPDMTTVVEQRPGVTIHLFLAGCVDATIGGRPLRLGREPGGPVRGVISARARPVEFQRHARKGDQIRKANVTLSTDSLHEGAFGSSEDSQAVRQLAARHPGRFEWSAGPGLVSLAGQMLHPPACSESLRNLVLESRALDVVAEAFPALPRNAAAERHPALRPFARRRLRTVPEYTDAHSRDLPPLEEIARAAFALEREGSSVAAAAFTGGYPSPANCAAAFERPFGLKPTEVRRH